ncbi:MAG TPA: STAS domain-containing protein [Myxococcota bacterium]|nr:STAS domain-containing protein [Myxococcota bacterium]
MRPSAGANFATFLDKHGPALFEAWQQELSGTTASRRDLLKDADLRQEARNFLQCLREALRSDPDGDLSRPAWGDLRAMLEDLSRSRARLGFLPSETATFIFSLKRPMFTTLRADMEGRPQELADTTIHASLMLDKLGLFTTEVNQKAREQVIARQQQEVLELSTPVIQLWDGILGLPLIGTLDSRRTQLVMEALLQRLVDTGSEIAIIDITGVPTVDTLTAQHLLKTIAATRLMGAECIISGIRPQIAQTIVHLGVDLGDVVTKATLAGALQLAMERTGVKLQRQRATIASV